MKLVHRQLMGGLLHLKSTFPKQTQSLTISKSGLGEFSKSSLHLVQRGGTHPSTASVSITVLLYDDPLPCGFNVRVKGLIKPPSLLHCLTRQHWPIVSEKFDSCVNEVGRSCWPVPAAETGARTTRYALASGRSHRRRTRTGQRSSPAITARNVIGRRTAVPRPP